MATIQQLEKLYHILQLFQSGDSLESTVASERIQILINKTERQLQQRSFLREERRRLRISTELIEERKKALATLQRNDYRPQSLSHSTEKRILINVGGLMFEAPVIVLCRDKNSLLAQLCSPNPPFSPDPDGGFFYFDRDWWLFRYILTFLRDGTLPEDRALCAQLYREAPFWNLVELQTAIEEEKLHLRTKPLKDEEKDVWWRKEPSWWKALDEAKKAADAAAEAASKVPADWWVDTTYNGKQFLPLSTAPDKVVTKAGEKDAKLGASMTWSLPSKG